MLLAATLLLTLAPQHQATSPHGNRPRPELEDPGTPTGGELKTEIDRSLRWLRGRQDLESGGYGEGSALETATVLLAFARSHRSYRPTDGPYIARAVEHLQRLQREDGAFPDEELYREGIAAVTGTAVAALEALGLVGEDTAHSRAVEYLGADRARFATANAPVQFGSVAEARLRARALLATRTAEGFWRGGFLDRGPSVLLTARSVLELSAAKRTVDDAEPKASKGEVRPLPPLSDARRVEASKALERGAAFLLDAADEGRWGAMGRADAGITAMVVGALLEVPEPRGEALDAAIGRGLDWLVSLQKEDGSIHDGQLANYVTSATILALAKAGRPGDADVIAEARAFLQELQADEGEGYDPSHHYYGGVGYGGDERPDLSNLQMALEALSAAGLEAGDPTFAKALRFLQRSQNRSESNDVALGTTEAPIRSGNDGGGVYAPGESKAGTITLADGTRVPRSYGSMTYALLKGYLFAGLPREDARVKAAWSWLRENYTLDVNPGFEASSDPSVAYQGLYYYFYTMARALSLWGEATVVDASGTAHDWRAELTQRLAVLQRPDGSWVNSNSPRWWEGNPVLATAYAMLTLGITSDGAPSD